MTAVTGYPNEPPGLIAIGPISRRYLAFDSEYIDPPGSPWADARRTMGWYYGYPTCCIEAFIARSEANRAEQGEWLRRQPRDGPYEGTSDDPRPALERWPHHPLSGHVLCHRCEAGPRAPLPPRPAVSYGFVLAGDDEEPVVFEPSDYEPLQPMVVPAVPVFEQLALEEAS